MGTKHNMLLKYYITLVLCFSGFVLSQQPGEATKRGSAATPPDTTAQQLIPRVSSGWKFSSTLQTTDAWQTASFDDSSWQDVALPFGFGETDAQFAQVTDPAMFTATREFYLRKKFT